MDEMHHVPNLMYVFGLSAIALFVFNLRRFFLINIGKKEDKPSNNLVQGIRNVLVYGVGQWRVNSKRFSYATVMHIFIGWGMFELIFATGVDMFTKWGLFTSLLPAMDTPWFAALNDFGGLILFIGLMMALYRRHIQKPELLPQNAFKGRGYILGDTGLVLMILLLDIGGFFSEASRLAIEQPLTASASFIGFPLSKLAVKETWLMIQPYLWWGHALTSFFLIAIIPMTKMFHGVAVLVNAGLTNMDGRGKVRTMHVSKLMEDPEADIDNISLGSSTVKELTWKQLLDSITCTECSRCTTVCPANNSGKPLSPMGIMTDVRDTLYAKEHDKILPGDVISETALWSCTTCGACMEECPVLIDHIPTFTDLRRYLVLSEGKPPAQANESLEKTMNTGNPYGFSQNDRTKWAKDAGIELPIMAEKKESDVLFWVGCAGAYDPRNQQVAKSMVKILEETGVDYGVLGEEEMCTGDSARRMGEEYLYETMALQNIETLDQYKFNSIVTTCPHCFHTIGNEYPDFGGKYTVKHHSQFINELISSGKLSVNNEKMDVTYHDPCYLGRHNKEYNAPRNVIKSVVQSDNLKEMDQSKDASYCCGAGGGNMWHDIEEGDRINHLRFDHVLTTGASTVATACYFCTTMMDDAIKVRGKEDAVQVRDIAEIVAENIQSK